MPMPARSTLLRPLLVVALVLAASGCSGMKGMFKDKDKNEGLPVSQLYDKAHTSMEQGRWSTAAETFGTIVIGPLFATSGWASRSSASSWQLW